MWYIKNIKRDKRIIIGVISVMILCSCVFTKNGLFSRYKKRNINLTSISGQVKIGYETEKAIIYFGKQDVISFTERLLMNKKLDPRFDRDIINDLKNNLDTLRKVKNDFIVQHWMSKQRVFNLHDYDFAGFIDQWVFKDLILKGNSEVINKTSNETEEKVFYHYIRDKLGNEECYYSFKSGVEFHTQVIALGE
ncbi:hypothetical protein [Aquimarina sediminis]|uniref:hypothetical protein n=1 Tax=Aquimarina sediminis TaxID=2070536 RepID=UPI000CA059B5|nr:hypothetical protein [Aquimarina sediminis]